jgi:hypothetical protein
MAWYQIVNTHGDSYVADQEAEDLLRHFSAALRDADGPVHAEVFYGRTPAGARVYYFSLSRAAFDIAKDVLAAYEVTLLAEPPDLRGMEHIHRA